MPARRPALLLRVLVAVVLLCVFGAWLYLHNSRAELDRRIADSTATITAESTRAPFTTLESYDAADTRAALVARRRQLAGTQPLKTLLSRGSENWPAGSSTPAYKKAHDMTMEMRGRAEVAESAASEKEFKDSDLNVEAMRAIGEWREAIEKEKLAAASS